MAPVECRVVARRQERPDTVTLTTARTDGVASPFRPGQFDMLLVPGVGEVAISRSGDPRACGVLHHTIASVGAVTEALCGLQPGDTLGHRGPFGTAWPAKGISGDVVVVSGGLGLAPLRPAVLSVLRARDARLTILAGSRTPAHELYPDDLDTWEAAGAEVLRAADRGGPGWLGHVGLVTDLVPAARFDPHVTTAFVCGPEPMMVAAASALRRAGVEPHRIHVSLERNMECGVGLCGHCQLGPLLLCRDGPVVGWDGVAPLLEVAEL
jgi:NAD(P)H-flavin reductase